MNFGIPLPPDHPYYGVWRHHCGREPEELDGGNGENDTMLSLPNSLPGGVKHM
ncbi:hypothetical protein GYMLUDRAFT_39417 [Collybiopsis luxurians FD-317 M1]|nr:hypothetical protein GYMLUDRAFT_39417 [Collybiopsis luxurians FD-317 M1]